MDCAWLVGVCVCICRRGLLLEFDSYCRFVFLMGKMGKLRFIAGCCRVFNRFGWLLTESMILSCHFVLPPGLGGQQSGLVTQ